MSDAVSEIPAGIVSPLLAWYREHKRKLPWRDQGNAYYTWVSEIMLQQTRVEAVKDIFARFIARLPDVKALAACEEDEVLKLWEGLGYYTRGRNLLAAAKQIVRDYDGRIPEDYDTLLTLKGIGEYTAGAIASIAFGKCVPVVDGNVLRVAARLTGEEREITQLSVRAQIRSELLRILPCDSPGDFNQAVMELGALVCIPNGKPYCSECPLKLWCKAAQEGAPERYPVRRRKKERRIEKKTILVIRDGEDTILQKRPGEGLLAGMYGFPDLPGHVSASEAAKYLENLGFVPVEVLPLEDSSHVFSHVEWSMHAYLIRVTAFPNPFPSDYVRVSPEDRADRYSVPSAYKAYDRYFNP